MSVGLGIDVGTERTGLAITDDRGVMALPLETVAAKQAAHRVVELVEERGVSFLVVGWPLDMNGKATRAVRRVESFLRDLDRVLSRAKMELPIYKFDERLTTSGADVVLRKADVRGKRRDAVIDQVAATHILQAFIDSENSSK